MHEQQARLRAALADRYRIERELGQGGMATVFLAEDLKHRRKVALKVLKPELAAVLGAERFVLEIATTASLSHPHILPLFDSGTADGFLYYVMPYVEGETLRSKLDRERQLGVDDAVRIAREVAEALEYAHSRGVIHRDIKPENILMQGGRPMVADFGIALAVSAAAGGRLTETGLSLGTPHYMSPEQATAEKEITGRSDVYSLASVLYEMLTGEPPHMGNSAQQIIMKIITEPAAAVTKLRKSVPPNVAAALAKALEKLPADRFASAREFAEALAAPTFTHEAVTPAPARARPGDGWRAAAAIPAIALSALLFAALVWSLTRPEPPAPVSRYEVAWRGAAAGEFGSLAVSPDGARLVTVVEVDGTSRLFVRRRDHLEVTELPGTIGAFNPAFSPGGDRVAFMVGPTIRVADLDGRLSSLVTDSLVGAPGLAWGHDGYLYYDRRGIGPLMRVRERGGVPEAVSTLDSTTGELQHVWPDALPNGRGVIMVVNRGGPGQGGAETDAIAVLDLRTGKHRELVRGVFARYAVSGHLIYVTRDGDLFGVPFDADRLEVTGPAVVLAQGVSVRTGGSGAVDLSIANDGTLWYSTGGQVTAQRELVWATRDGTLSPFSPPVTGDIFDASIAPDGARVAFVLREREGAHVWVTRSGSGNRERRTFQGSSNRVSWHPDGRELLVTSMAGELLSVPSDGSRLPTPLAIDRRTVVDASWSPDGRWLVYSAQGRSKLDLFGIGPGADSTPRELHSDAVGVRSGSVSPDGRWLLFQSSLVDVGNVFVRPFPDTDASLWQVSQNRGREPRWSAGGREILYRTFTDSLVSVPVLPGVGFTIGTPRTLFSVRGVSRWDVTPDGKRFLLVRARDADEEKRLMVVENFHEELRTKVPR